MPPQDQLELISPGGQVAFYDLPPGGVTLIGRHPGNQVVIDTPDVASFHAVLDHRQKPYQILLLSHMGEMTLGEQRLSLRVPSPLRNGSVIQLDGHALIFLEAEATPVRPVPFPVSDPSLPSRETPPRADLAADGLDDIIIADISERQWTVDVEQTATCQVTVTNGGAGAATFGVNVEGLDEGWAVISPTQVNLNAGEQATVSIAITPPRQPASYAGVHPMAVVVTSPHHPGRRSQHRATLVVRPYYEFAVDELSPKQQSLSRFQHSAQLLVPIANKSNSEVTFRLAGTDEAGDCHVEFQLPGEVTSLAAQVELRLAPGETFSVPARITPPSRPVIGLRKRSHHFTFTTTMLAGRPTSRSVLAQLGIVPFIGPWLIAFVTCCLVALVVFVVQTRVEYTQAEPRLAGVGDARISDQANPAVVSYVWESEPASSSSNVEAVARSELSYEEMFQEIAAQYELDWRMLAELAYQESRMDPLAIGKDNDQGLMQIIPSTWDEWAPEVSVSDPFDTYSNVLVGAAYLAYLREYCTSKGHPEAHWMLVGYNWGPDNLRQLFESNGGWDQVPAKQRRYALDILQATSSASARWRRNLPEAEARDK